MPMVAAGFEADLVAEMADYQHGIDLGAPGDRFIDIGLERNQLAAALAAIGGDDEAAGGILQPAVQRLGREAAEDDAVDRADPGAGEHRHRRLGNHRQIEGDAVAFPGAERLQAIGHAHHVGVQFAIGDVAGDPGLVALPDDCGLVRPGGEMPVDGIVAEVEDAILIPFDIDRIVGPVADRGRRRHPIEPLRLLTPEAVRILQRSPVQRIILCSGAVGALKGGRRRGDDLGHPPSY